MPHCSDFSNDHMNSHFPVLMCSDYRWFSKEIGNIGNWKRSHPYRGLVLINIHFSPDATKWRESSVRNLLWSINDWRVVADWWIKDGTREFWLWRICVLERHSQYISTSRRSLSSGETQFEEKLKGLLDQKTFGFSLQCRRTQSRCGDW